ncbi:alpha-ketoglutarate-dependent dioxygenase AlkB [Jiulongibacter sediminis]|jgi:alkylated DNA repair dioxygenase AlkB|uniref:alpha-ketoglutarate-dependent dioxygenase AlkB family protein n=1 Tax=Jiulongibacter sediminis TaxID=1605367 RepID=UPI00286E88F9|nr:alpha-ketoglutarate-dependent dioxygenase AlkB [Jiulongibacter sediminis]
MLNLFPPDAEQNLLPKDGIVHYFGWVYDVVESSQIFDKLWTEIDWRNDEAFIYGKRIVTKRKVAWYGDEPFEYTYSKTTKTALLWTEELLKIKQKTEEVSGETYNSCLLNLYHDGSEAMGWHADNESEMKPEGAIASWSFGAERKFALKHKESKETMEVWLENGSLLLMKGATQKHWLHRLPPTKKVKAPRINLTFRTIV